MRLRDARARWTREKVESSALKAIREEEDLGARTYNHYLQAIDEFGKWLVATKRLPGNPVAGIDG